MHPHPQLLVHLHLSSAHPVRSIPRHLTTPLTDSASNCPVAAVRPGSRTASTVSDAAYQELAAKHNDQKLINDGLEKERDFYFSKVRSAFASPSFGTNVGLRDS